MGGERGVSVYELQETIREVRGGRQTNTASTAAPPCYTTAAPRVGTHASSVPRMRRQKMKSKEKRITTRARRTFSRQRAEVAVACCVGDGVRCCVVLGL